MVIDDNDSGDGGGGGEDDDNDDGVTLEWGAIPNGSQSLRNKIQRLTTFATSSDHHWQLFTLSSFQPGSHTSC